MIGKHTIGIFLPQNKLCCYVLFLLVGELNEKDDRVISALILTRKMLPQNIKSGLYYLYLTITFLNTSYIRSFAAIYMNRCIGDIFNAIYRPES